MLIKPVKQERWNHVNDYNNMWEEVVASVVQKIYKNEQFFVNAYASNSYKVFKALVNSLKIVPIDLKETLHAFYKRLNTAEADGPKSVA
jgi:hypothetical protein